MKKTNKQTKKPPFHPQNFHQGTYDLDALTQTSAELAGYLFINPYGNQTLDFSNPKAVLALNRALLRHYYHVDHWGIPEGFLCPPIPGRADYIHYLGDLLAQSNDCKRPDPSKIQGLDIGTGANLIYPLLGVSIQGWKLVGSESNPQALISAEKILNDNPTFHPKIELRAQLDASSIFKGIIQKEECYDFTLCNPPFHDSANTAMEGSQRKTRNLTGKIDSKPVLNFGGQASELWTAGGELAFIKKMIVESVEFKNQVYWFTSLVSKSENLKALESLLKRSGVYSQKVIEMAQGNKKSRFLAWTFLDVEQQEAWRKFRWA
jgi:23S rRNA (adenine1618-N6)-methyltransferase